MLLHEITNTKQNTIELRTHDNILVLLPGPLSDAAILANAKINQRYRVIADRSPDLISVYEPADWKTIAIQKKKRQVRLFFLFFSSSAYYFLIRSFIRACATLRTLITLPLPQQSRPARLPWAQSLASRQ